MKFTHPREWGTYDDEAYTNKLDALLEGVDIQLCGDCHGSSLYMNVKTNDYFFLTDNGGEVLVTRPNVDKGTHGGEFPYTIWSEPINPETFVYRLLQVLKGEAIDYDRVEEEIEIN